MSAARSPTSRSAAQACRAGVDQSRSLARPRTRLEKHNAEWKADQKLIKDSLEGPDASLARSTVGCFRLLNERRPAQPPPSPTCPASGAGSMKRLRPTSRSALARPLRRRPGRLPPPPPYRTRRRPRAATVRHPEPAPAPPWAYKATAAQPARRWNHWAPGPAQWTLPQLIRTYAAFLSQPGRRLNRVLAVCVQLGTFLREGPLQALREC